MFLDQQGLETCNASLRHVWCGGEVLPLELQKRFHDRLAATLYNGYGPTETSIGVTLCVCERENDLPTVPIGRPIANTQVYLLDRHLQPVPVGVPGELHVAGVGLGRGYLKRPGLSSERFIPNPFAPRRGAGTRLYETGDLARYLPDGRIEFLGRMDDQVKLRGFRIELREIEAILGQYPAVRQVAVLAREDVPGDKRLVAYLALDRQQMPTVEILHRRLKETLPVYMVPATLVQLDALPLATNGKIDRKALQALESPDVKVATSYVAPQSKVEQTLAALWQEILNLKQVGVYDNFFDLGGHSLHLVKIRGRLQEIYGHELPIVELFRHSTIHSLARFMRQEQLEQPLFPQVQDRAVQQREAMEQQMRRMELVRVAAGNATHGDGWFYERLGRDED
jgi:hypothetical protein